MSRVCAEAAWAVSGSAMAMHAATATMASKAAIPHATRPAMFPLAFISVTCPSHRAPTRHRVFDSHDCPCRCPRGTPDAPRSPRPRRDRDPHDPFSAGPWRIVAVFRSCLPASSSFCWQISPFAGRFPRLLAGFSVCRHAEVPGVLDHDGILAQCPVRRRLLEKAASVHRPSPIFRSETASIS